MNIDPQRLGQFANLLIAIRHARAAFARSGKPPQYWNALASGIRADLHAGVPPAQISRTVEAWTERLAFTSINHPTGWKGDNQWRANLNPRSTSTRWPSRSS